ncbi:MAG: EboA domain-containing protein [Myxococcales bacterium]|nr:EboA domain-containing protein [Myxococcales bacterium]
MEREIPTTEAAERLLSVVRAHGEALEVERLESKLPSAGTPLARGAFFGLFAGAGRRFGRKALSLSEAERESLAGLGLIESERHGLPALVRAALLLRAHAVLDPEAVVELVAEAFEKGDTGERVAVLRSLSLLPAPERFTELAVEACRSHVQEVFEAVACDNPFAAAHFSELAFNQMIVKVLFTEVPLARVHGWRQRNNDELRRMVRDYGAERRAAGRSIPSDIARIEESTT